MGFLSNLRKSNDSEAVDDHGADVAAEGADAWLTGEPAPPDPQPTSGWDELVSSDNGAHADADPSSPAVASPVEPLDRVPGGAEATPLLEILGLGPDATWHEVRIAHRTLITEHDPSTETDPERASLARAIRREMNSAYAALRLLRVPDVT